MSCGARYLCKLRHRAVRGGQWPSAPCLPCYVCAFAAFFSCSYPSHPEPSARLYGLPARMASLAGFQRPRKTIRACTVLLCAPREPPALPFVSTREQGYLCFFRGAGSQRRSVVRSREARPQGKRQPLRPHFDVRCWMFSVRCSLEGHATVVQGLGTCALPAGSGEVAEEADFAFELQVELVGDGGGHLAGEVKHVLRTAIAVAKGRAPLIRISSAPACSRNQPAA